MTDITPADLQNLTPEQLQALAVQIQNEQAAAQAVDQLLEQPSGETSAATAAAEPSATSATTTAEPAALVTTPVAGEAPINPVANAVLNGVNVATAAASAAAPVVAIIDPPAGVAIELAVAVVNALEAMGGYLGLIPEGMAKQGIQSQIATIKKLVS